MACFALALRAVALLLIVFGLAATYSTPDKPSPRGFSALRQHHKAAQGKEATHVAANQSPSKDSNHVLAREIQSNAVLDASDSQLVEHPEGSLSKRESSPAQRYRNVSTPRLQLIAVILVSNLISFISGIYIGRSSSRVLTTSKPLSASPLSDAQPPSQLNERCTEQASNEATPSMAETSIASRTEDDACSLDGGNTAHSPIPNKSLHNQAAFQPKSPSSQSLTAASSAATSPLHPAAPPVVDPLTPTTPCPADSQPNYNQHPTANLPFSPNPNKQSPVATSSDLANSQSATQHDLSYSSPLGAHSKALLPAHSQSPLPAYSSSPLLTQGSVGSLVMSPSCNGQLVEAQSPLVALHSGQSLVNAPSAGGLMATQNTLVVVHHHTLDPRLTELLLRPVNSIAEGFHKTAQSVRDLAEAASSLSSGLGRVASTTRHLTDSLLASWQLSSQGALASKVMHCGLAVHLAAAGWSAAVGGRLQEISSTCASRQRSGDVLGRVMNGMTGGVVSWGRVFRCYVRELGQVFTGFACAVALFYAWRAMLRGSNLSGTWAFDIVVVLGVAVGAVGAQAMSRLGASWVVWLLMWWGWCGGVGVLSQKQIGRWRQVGAALMLGLGMPVVAGVVPFLPLAVQVQGRVEEVFAKVELVRWVWMR